MQGSFLESTGGSVLMSAEVPDPSTVRRWAQRRLLSVCCWIKSGVKDQHFLQTPTIVAWDLGALGRILPIEARSP